MVQTEPDLRLVKHVNKSGTSNTEHTTKHDFHKFRFGTDFGIQIVAFCEVLQYNKILKRDTFLS